MLTKSYLEKTEKELEEAKLQIELRNFLKDSIYEILDSSISQEKKLEVIRVILDSVTPGKFGNGARFIGSILGCSTEEWIKMTKDQYLQGKE